MTAWGRIKDLFVSGLTFHSLLLWPCHIVTVCLVDDLYSLSRYVWMTSIETSQSRGSVGMGGSGVERQGRCCVWNPPGKVCRHRGKGSGQKGGSLTQPTQQATLVSMAACCITKPSVSSMRYDIMPWDHWQNEPLCCFWSQTNSRIWSRIRFCFTNICRVMMIISHKWCQILKFSVMMFKLLHC